jgi:hypothetical protein
VCGDVEANAQVGPGALKRQLACVQPRQIQQIVHTPGLPLALALYRRLMALLLERAGDG